MSDFADISSHQAGADLAAYARAGHDRILIKASQGTGYANPYFGGWWRSAGQAGLARGAYHYATPSTGSTGQAEADQFDRTLRAAGGLGPRDWLCLDVEDPDELGPAAADHAAAFCARMVQLGYAGGVIYSGTWYLGPVGLTAVMLPERWQWLHLADYRTAVPDSALPLPAGWSPGRLLARQYTDKADQPGIPGASDRNRVLREWLPSAARAIEEDDMPSADEVADALMARLWGQMTEPPPGAAPDWYPPRQPHPGAVLRRDYEMTGAALSVATAVREDTAAIRAALAEVLGADHPATSALAPTPQRVTVDDLVALAPQVTPADAARVVRAYAPRLDPTPVTPT